MAVKQLTGRTAPDGSEYVTLVDGAGNLSPASGGAGGSVSIDQTTPGTTNGVVVNSSALPTGAATSANQTSQITQETAVNTVLGVKTDAKSTATDTTSVSAVSIWKQISASVQAIATSVAATLSTNVAQWAGTTAAAGSGAMTAGTPRVALATDSPGIVTTGTAGSASATVLTVQGIASMTPVQVGLAAITTGGYSYSHIATATTTTVKSGAGNLHSIVINAKGTVASTTTVYDNTAGSGTVIAVLDTLTTGFGAAGTLMYDIQFSTGLTLVTTGTVAPDITVTYK